jgi:C-terminal processing protease CtpA/Prc
MSFFNGNTDGLIIDVMRNPGGIVSYVENLCQATIPNDFQTIGFEIRATQSWVLSFQQSVAGLRLGNGPDWLIALLEFYGRALETAYLENRGRTGPLPLGNLSLELSPTPGAYTKPLIVLTDDFSASGADMFPAIIQDASRGLIVGTRTSGAGGSVTNSPATAYSEGLTRVTQSLMVRPNAVTVAGYPTTQYVENVGVHPDVTLDFMTRENLVNSGRPFLNEAIRILLDRINAN